MKRDQPESPEPALSGQKFRMPSIGSAWSKLRSVLPQLGRAGSRSAELHAPLLEVVPPGPSHELAAANSADAPLRSLSPSQSASIRKTFVYLRWLGTTGALLIALGGLGAGALPVVGNPYDNVFLGPLLSRMLPTASALVFVGIALIVTAWLGMAPFAGSHRFLPRGFYGTLGRGLDNDVKNDQDSEADSPAAKRIITNQDFTSSVSERDIWRTWASWVIPLIPTAPLFTQDIYSYIANGAIVRLGLDPYSAGPVQLLGADHPLARSVPFIWANSPSPYGPVSLGIAGLISWMSQDLIVVAVIAHRLVSIAGIIAAGWAISQLSRRCGISPVAALWLGILNPLTLLHLVGGIHNEGIMLGFVLCGMELGLRGAQKLNFSLNGQTIKASVNPRLSTWQSFARALASRGGAELAASGFLLSCAGMVKVTGFIGLGFVGMAAARELILRVMSTDDSNTRNARATTFQAVFTVGVFLLAVMTLSIGIVTAISGINLGWIFGQGGAVSIRSWLSTSTDVGVISGFIGMLLGLGDHTEAMLKITRAVGVAIAGAFTVRMLFATLRGSIHPVGALGVSTLILVVFFPVVHPWYILWAILPLAAWANRHFFKVAVTLYSAPMAFAVLPRGLGLEPWIIAVIYATTIVTFSLVLAGSWFLMRRHALRGLN